MRFKPNLSRSRFGRYTNHEPAGTKAMLMDVLARKKLELVIERENIGAWNECRNFKVGGATIDVVMKSGKPDWDYMIQEVEKMK
jgi:hypothetical protein